MDLSHCCCPLHLSRRTAGWCVCVAVQHSGKVGAGKLPHGRGLPADLGNDWPAWSGWEKWSKILARILLVAPVTGRSHPSKVSSASLCLQCRSLCGMPGSPLRSPSWFSPAFWCGQSLVPEPLWLWLRNVTTLLAKTEIILWLSFSCVPCISLISPFYEDWKVLRCGPPACGQDRPPDWRDSGPFSPMNISGLSQSQRRAPCPI